MNKMTNCRHGVERMAPCRECVAEGLRETLYLCGGINALSDSDARDWRDAIAKELAGLYAILDPMRRDYRGRELQQGVAEEIVRGDIADIDHSNILLVNANKPSWGTAMELFYAYTKGKYVVTVCDNPKPSPWLLKHSDILVPSFALALQELKDML